MIYAATILTSTAVDWVVLGVRDFGAQRFIVRRLITLCLRQRVPGPLPPWLAIQSLARAWLCLVYSSLAESFLCSTSDFFVSAISLSFEEYL